MATTTKLEPIRLSFRDKGRQVVVEPADEDRFMMSIEDAARACQQAIRAVQFGEQFKSLLGCLGAWLVRNSGGKVSHAYLTLRDAGLLFIVIQASRASDESLEDSLVDLDIEIARDENLNLIELDVLPLPATSEEAYSSFLNPKYTWTFPHAK